MKNYLKQTNWKKCLKRFALGLLIALVISYFLPTGIKNPVEGCGRESYNQASFWHPHGDDWHFDKGMMMLFVNPTKELERGG